MQRQPRKPALHELEKNDNQIVLDGIILNGFPRSYQDHDKKQQIEQIKQRIASFAEDHLITLMDLKDNEREDLRILWAKSLQSGDENELGHALQAWKKELKLAVAGQGEHVAIAAAQERGMAADLIQTGSVPFAKWGTDLDIRHCLGLHMTDPLDIYFGGGYILPPEELTESPEALAKTLAIVFDQLHQFYIEDSVQLSIPVCCRNQHWCLVKIEISGRKIVSAIFWDPKNEYKSSLRATREFDNLKAVVTRYSDTVTPDVECPGVQTNNHSCMDYTLQEAYSYAGFADNAITLAESEDELRAAIVKQIAANLPRISENISYKYNVLSDELESGRGTVQSLERMLREAIQEVREEEWRRMSNLSKWTKLY